MDIYSKDLRIRALAAVDRGIPRREVVELFSISLTTLKRWIKMRREGEDLSPGLSTGRRRRILATPRRRGFCGTNSRPTTMPPSSATANRGSTRGALECPSPP
jgi:transposase-like protein